MFYPFIRARHPCFFRRGLGPLLLWGLVVPCLATPPAGAAPAESPLPQGLSGLAWSQMADASAGEWLGHGLFVAASDEDNVLRVYPLQQCGAPVATWDAAPEMALLKKAPEMDIEGSAKINDTIYWITSHAPNKDGKPRPNRKRFFATRIAVTNGTPAFQLVGRPVASLLADLDRDPRYAAFHLAAAALRPPKTPGSLNIEALCDTSAGELLIGFRSPTPAGKALLAPLLNPAETVAGQAPRFGDPLLINLCGNGIRAMARAGGNRYFIIAGSPLSGGTAQFYRWDGQAAPQPDTTALAGLPADVTPEGLIAVDVNGAHALLVLSDDGRRLVDGLPAKSHPDPARRTFRGFLLENP